MCGIAGIIGRLDESNRAALERMNDAMIHRGPDASGTWLSAPDARGWGALLAHRRLSILDLSPAGAQPMVDPVTGHALVFNGTSLVANYQALLQTVGYQSTSDNPTDYGASPQRTLTWAVSDGTAVTTRTTTVAIVAVNDAPQETAATNATYGEGSAPAQDNSHEPVKQ